MVTRITLYDDNEALRQSIETLLNDEHDMEFIAGILNAETVETDVKELQPDVILMDIDMPTVNGVQAVHRIRKIHDSFLTLCSPCSTTMKIFSKPFARALLVIS